MSKIKKVKTLPQNIKEIKKKETNSEKKEVENKIDNKNLEDSFSISRSKKVSSTLTSGKNLEEISSQEQIISKETMEGERNEVSELYDNKETSVYESNSSKESSEEKTYELSNSPEIIRETKNELLRIKEDNFQRENFSRIPDFKNQNKERDKFEEVQKREYDSGRETRRKYLM